MNLVKPIIDEMKAICQPTTTRKAYMYALFLSLTTAVVVGWFWPGNVSFLELSAVATSFITTMLIVFEKRSAFVWMVLTTLLYCVLFFQSNLYASAAVQLFFIIPMAIYGYMTWGHDDSKPVTWWYKDQNKFPTWLAAVPLIFVCLVVINIIFGGSMPLLDTSILFLTVLAQMLMTHKKLENWIVWAVLNVIAIYVYYSSGLYFVVAQYIFFLANTLYGWLKWSQNSRESE